GASGDQVHTRGQGEVRREGGEAGLAGVGREDERPGLQWSGAARPDSVERREAQELQVLNFPKYGMWAGGASPALFHWTLPSRGRIWGKPTGLRRCLHTCKPRKHLRKAERESANRRTIWGGLR